MTSSKCHSAPTRILFLHSKIVWSVESWSLPQVLWNAVPCILRVHHSVLGRECTSAVCTLHNHTKTSTTKILMNIHLQNKYNFISIHRMVCIFKVCYCNIYYLQFSGNCASAIHTYRHTAHQSNIEAAET